jgi:HPt (histidine-containing phosphotransfer) domain-containing protein
MEPATALRGRLLDLKQRFVRTIPDRIEAITSSLADCRDGGSDGVDRLERQFHTLAGTAGTYDLNAIAAAAFEGEEACGELHQAPPDHGDYTYLAFLVDQLHGAMAIDAPAQWAVLHSARVSAV